MRPTLAIASICLLSCATPLSAWAQGANASTNAPATAEARDVVRIKKSGEVVRGRIDELVPNEYVVITPADGWPRRFEMKDVEYAGPDPEPSGATPEPPEPEATQTTPEAPAPAPARRPAPGRSRATKSTVKLVSRQENITFHARPFGAVDRGPGESFTELCATPCEVELDHGFYTFAVSSQGGPPMPSDEAMKIGGPKTLQGRIKSYSGARTAGWIVLVGGAAAGAALVLTSGTEECSAGGNGGERCGLTFVPARLIAGAAIASISVVTGLVFAFKEDEVFISVVPGVPAKPPPAASQGAVSLQRFQGLTLSARF